MSCMQDDPHSKDMCPSAETNFRVINDLIHPLEKEQNGRVVAVKKYNRSAAGTLFKKSEIRSPDTCLRTARYLISGCLLDDRGLSLKVRYDFVADRLRAVRQDLIIQKAESEVTREVNAISVKFHLVCGNSLHHLPKGEFDPNVNFKILLECLKDVIILDQNLDLPIDEKAEMISVYLLLNLGSDTTRSFVLKLRKELRCRPQVHRAMEISSCYALGNFVRLFRLTQKISVIEKLALSWKRLEIISSMLQVMNIAYNSKVLRFPLIKLSQLCDLSEDILVEILTRFGLKLVDNSVSFQKGVGNFNQLDNLPCINEEIAISKETAYLILGYI